MISIIIPVLNAENYIRDCITSIVDQDFPKDQYEIIIIDNGSKDNTYNVIMDIIHNGNVDNRIIITREPKKGAYMARNTGIKISKGDIIAFTDADCITDKNWLKELYKGFNPNNVGCVVGLINPYNGNTIVEIYSKNKEVLSQKQTLVSKFLPYGQTANVAYRKDVFDKIGLFDFEMMTGGDADIAWRMQIYTDYKLVYESKAIVEHRHRTSFKGFFKQQFRYGFGRILLYKKYHDRMVKVNIDNTSNNVKHNHVDIMKIMMKLMLTLNLFYIRSFKRLFGLCDRYQLYEPLLYFIYMSGFALGEIYGWIKLRTIFNTDKIE